MPWRHWKSTTPRSVTGGLPGTGFELEAAAALARRAAAADRHEARARSARQVDPLLLACQVLQAEAHVHRVVCLAVARHRAADAHRVAAGRQGLHTSIVAHSSCECSSVCFAGVVLAVPACGLAADAAGASAGERAPRSGGQADRRARVGRDHALTIAPPVARGADVRPAAAACVVVSPGAMGARRSADVVELLGRVPVFSTLEPDDLAADRRGGACRGASSRVRRCSARATPATPATSCARATRARCAATATGARSRSPRSGPATSSASWPCSRTSSARPRSRRSSRRASSACSAPTCAG